MHLAACVTRACISAWVMSLVLMLAKCASACVMSISLQVKVNGCLCEAFTVTDRWAQHFLLTARPFGKQHGLAQCASVRV